MLIIAYISLFLSIIYILSILLNIQFIFDYLLNKSHDGFSQNDVLAAFWIINLYILSTLILSLFIIFII
jgi:hypothetical protein